MTDIFSAPLGPNARRADPDTSVAAAELHPVTRGHDRAIALVILARNPAGLTDFELAAHMARQQTSAGKRRGELRDNGYVRDSKTRRPAPSGSPAIVWSITPEGVEAARIVSRETVPA